MKRLIKKIICKMISPCFRPYEKRLEILENNKLNYDSSCSYERRLDIVESGKSIFHNSAMSINFQSEQMTPYKILINQSDLVSYEQNFFSAAQIIQMNIYQTPYIQTYPFEGGYINKNHEYYAQDGLTDTGIEGWLLPEDALKIYELTYFSKGDILQLGTYKGLSASVIIQAIKDNGKGLICDTVDVNSITTDEAKCYLKTRFKDLDSIHFHIYDGNLFMDSMIVQNRKYGFVFVDASHGYKNTYMNALRLNRLLLPGGFALFHDYFDGRNFDTNSHYNVYQAVNDALLTDNRFLYCGSSGCSALFRFIGSSVEAC